MDKNEEVFRGLVDAIVAHPSTKPHIPTSTREVQLEAEIRRFRVEVRELIYRLEAILNAFEYRLGRHQNWLIWNRPIDPPFGSRLLSCHGWHLDSRRTISVP